MILVHVEVVRNINSVVESNLLIKVCNFKNMRASVLFRLAFICIEIDSYIKKM